MTTPTSFNKTGLQNFAVAGNWTPNGIPGATDDALINSAAFVGNTADEGVNSIGTGTNGTNVLAISGNSTFYVADGTNSNKNSGEITVFQATLELGGGTFDNPGTLWLMGDDATDLATLWISGGSVILDGGGTLKMTIGGGPTANEIVGRNLNGDTDFSNVNNTISGDGTIGGGLFFTNEGMIETNNSTSTSGGTLVIQGSAGNFDGNLGVFVNSGTVQADSGGTLIFGIDNIASTIYNDGTINLISNGGASSELEIAAGGVTIQSDSQTGVINLEGSSAQDDAIISDGKPATLTLVNQPITGAGFIGDFDLTLDNQSGTIDPTGTISLYFLGQGPAIINGGTLEAINFGSDLWVQQNINNTGTIQAANGGSVTLDGTFSGSGAIDIGTGGLITLSNPGQVTGNITFTGSNGSLESITSSPTAASAARSSAPPPATRSIWATTCTQQATT